MMLCSKAKYGIQVAENELLGGGSPMIWKKEKRLGAMHIMCKTSYEHGTFCAAIPSVDG